MRIYLGRGAQKELIRLICIKNKLKLKQLAEALNVSYSAIKRYYNEISLMSNQVFETIIRKYKFNREDFKIRILPEHWGSQKGGKKGIRVLLRKYDRDLPAWRLKGANQSKRARQKVILLPELSEDLCEFFGAVLGDGTLTKNFIRISGDSRYDQEYFAYLNSLARNLFGVEGVIEKDKRRNIAYLRFCSVKLCQFVRGLGLPFGKKVNIKISNKVLSKRNYRIALLRGLMDTDGSLCKRGNRLALVFTSYSRDLLNFAESLGSELEVFTHKNESQVGTDSWPKICKYFEVVGSSNPRHIICFLAKQKANRLIYKVETENFKNLYSGVKPYRARGLVVRTRSR